jgi:hypothetical protein
VTIVGLSIDLELDPDLAACVHSRQSPVRTLWVRNAGDRPALVTLRIGFRGLTSRPWLTPALRLASGEDVDVLAVQSPPRIDAAALVPAAPAEEVTFEVTAEAAPEGEPADRSAALLVSRRVRLHGPRAWPMAHRDAVTAFVRPSAPVITRQLAPALVRRLGDTPRALLAAAGPERAPRLLGAVLEGLGETLADLGVLVDREPFSVERTVQPVRLADDVVAEGRGTCVDLAVLAGGVLLELLGHGPYAPWLLLAPTSTPQILHAFVGVWVASPATVAVSDVRPAARDGALLVIDPTRAVRGIPSCDASTVTDALGPVWGVDIQRTHVDLPVPGLVAGPTLGEVGLRVRAEAVRAARGSSQLTSTHLLHGLLALGRLTARAAERLGVPSFRAELEARLAASRSSSSQEEPKTTSGFSGALGRALVMPPFRSPDDEEARLVLGVIEEARGRRSSLEEVGLRGAALDRFRALVFEDLGLPVPPVEDSAGRRIRSAP